MKEKPTSDVERALVFAWIDAKRVAGCSDTELEVLIYEAYDAGYHLESNGCTLVSELQWPIKSPSCVVHDYLYSRKRGFFYSNNIMRKLHAYFGRAGRGWVRWAGVTVFGGWFYRKS